MRVLLSLALVNVLATGVLFLTTVDKGEPFIAPLSEVSMALRWVVIAAVIAFLEGIAAFGWKRGG